MRVGQDLGRAMTAAVRGLALLLVLCGPGGPFAWAQEDPVQLTLEASVSMALARNNELRAGEFALKKAVWDTRWARALLLPSVDLNSRLTRVDAQTFRERDFRSYLPAEVADQMPQTAFRTSYLTWFEVSLPLFSRSLLNGVSIADASRDAAVHARASAHDRVVFEVVRTYLQVLKSREILELQDRYLDLSRLNLEKARRLNMAGRYSKTDVLRWQVEYQQQKGIVVRSRSELRSAMASMARLLGVRGKIQVDGPVPEDLLEESRRLAQLPDSEILGLTQVGDEALVQAQPGLAAAKAREEISRLSYRSAYSAYYPSLHLSYSHGWRENGTLALDDHSPKTLMVHFNLPIFSGFQRFASTRSALYDYRRSQALFENQIEDTRYLLTETANRLIALRAQRELSEAAVEYSEQNYRVVEQQREKGLVSNIDYVDAKLSLQNAKLDEVAVSYDFIAAMVELYYLLGRLESIAG